MFLFWIELQSSYTDWNRRIYAISTVTHTRWPGNNGRLLTTRNCVLTCAGQAKTLRIWGGMRFTLPYSVKINVLKKCVVVLIRKIILPHILYLQNFSLIPWYWQQYIYSGELSVAHKASISSFSFSICAVVTFQHVEKVFPDRCFSSTLFRKHFLTRTKGLHCRNEACL